MKRLQVMVVEDEEIVAADLEGRLRNLGYGVTAVVSSGEEALSKVAETNPDLVLMDISLRGQIDGVETAARIHERFDIPVVYITAHRDAATLRRAKITEPFGYIIKPFEERNLHATVEMALYKDKMERKLKQTKEQLATTLKGLGEAVVATDGEGRVTFMNPAAEALTGYKQEDVLGKDLAGAFKIIDEETRCPIEDSVTRAMREGIVIRQANQALLVARDGTETPIDENAAPIIDDKGKVTSVVLIFRDTSEHRRAEAALRTLSLTDDLTGLYNRRGFLTLAQQNLKLARRNKTGILLFFIDLDDLKQVNDTFGHQEGDRALIRTAEILKATFRDPDILARLGGDEFAVLVLDATSDSVDSITTRLQEILKNYNAQANCRYQLSFSMGAACFDPNGISSIDELIIKADDTLYAHKRSKRKASSR